VGLSQTIRRRRQHQEVIGATASKMDDPFNLQRFVDAQEPVYAHACTELREGRKRTHWMWFIFPQIEGLGTSPMTQKFAISSRQEAQAYLDHPILGPRLRGCAQLTTNVQGRSADQIFGYPDNLKFRSCMTLFANVASDNRLFVDAIAKPCGGKFDPATLERI
jgi:uncharacterized protein (DUF1810 family)